MEVMVDISFDGNFTAVVWVAYKDGVARFVAQVGSVGTTGRVAGRGAGCGCWLVCAAAFWADRIRSRAALEVEPGERRFHGLRNLRKGAVASDIDVGAHQLERQTKNEGCDAEEKVAACTTDTEKDHANNAEEQGNLRYFVAAIDRMMKMMC